MVSPTQLWSTTPTAQATVQDVAMDANGRMAAAVVSDGGLGNFDDNEVFAWDLARAKNSADAGFGHDPQGGITAPEGLRVVALEPAPAGKADLLAVGREGGSGSGNENEIYTYAISRGGGSAQNASYPSGGQPNGAVEALWFDLNGSRMLAHHEGTLSLLKGTGTSFRQLDTWSRSGATIQDVAVTPDLSYALVATSSNTPNQNGGRLDLLSLSDTAIEPAGSKTTTRSTFTAVALDDDARYVAAGDDAKTVFYWSLDPNQATKDDTDDRNFSKLAWTDTNGPGAVTELAMSGDGLRFAAGFDSGAFLVYVQTELEDDGPLATRDTNKPFATKGAPSEITFTNQDTTLFVQSGTVSSPGALYAFNTLQFNANASLNPLWLIDGVGTFAASENGNRLIVGQGASVAAYEQAYKAEITHAALSPLQPGDKFSLEVTVRNAGSAYDEYTLDLEDVPSGWSTQIDPPIVSVMPGESATVTANLTADRSQPPGDAPVTLIAQSRFAPGADPVGS
ncbi:MAG: NEW3 domain-containing protein, partial [Candidatus Thermoplasmatota archaeon]|nr:NEW3 domain-containing protein [Candidatus Thermoplasmatota archaeon]